mgnify:CR=1 FL=1
MMRRLPVILLTILALLLKALPALAQEGDPLAHSVLLPGTVGFALAGLAVLLFLLLLLWSARGPR